MRGKKTQEGNVSLHLPWNIADKSPKIGLPPAPEVTCLNYHALINYSEATCLFTWIPDILFHNVEVTILSTQAIQCTQCTAYVIYISPWRTRLESNEKLTCERFVQSERSVAEVGWPARKDMTEVSAMFCNSVCIPPPLYLPFAWFCMWGKCQCSLTVPCLLSIREPARPFVFYVCNYHSPVSSE